MSNSRRYIPPSFETRVENEEVTAYELEKLFTPDRFELMDININTSKGFAGMIFSLEGALVNIEMVYILAFNGLALQTGFAEPEVSSVLEVIGLTFRDAASQLNLLPLDLDHIEMKTLEVQFYRKIGQLIDTMELRPYPGAVELLDQAICEENEVTIVTVLPRNIAQTIFAKTKMVLLLEGRVDSRNLISLPSLEDMNDELKQIQDDLYDLENSINRFAKQKDMINAFHPTYGDRYYQNHLLKCCGRLYKAPMMVVYVDISHKIIQCAKKCGMSTIAVRGRASEVFSLRGSDKVVDDLSAVTMSDVYQVVRRAVQNAQGPAQQQVPVLKKPTQRRKASIETPLLDRPTDDIDEINTKNLAHEQSLSGQTQQRKNNSDDIVPHLSAETEEDEEYMLQWLDSSPYLDSEASDGQW